MTKQCSRCGLHKDVTQFNRRLESADGLSFWCLACDRRSRAHANVEAPWPAENVFPKRELACPVCAQDLTFETDRNGSAVQRCRCGVAFVPIREAPAVKRKAHMDRPTFGVA